MTWKKTRIKSFVNSLDSFEEMHWIRSNRGSCLRVLKEGAKDISSSERQSICSLSLSKILAVSVESLHCNFMIHDRSTLLSINEINDEMENRLKFPIKHISRLLNKRCELYICLQESHYVDRHWYNILDANRTSYYLVLCGQVQGDLSAISLCNSRVMKKGRNQ